MADTRLHVEHVEQRPVVTFQGTHAGGPAGLTIIGPN